METSFLQGTECIQPSFYILAGNSNYYDEAFNSSNNFPYFFQFIRATNKVYDWNGATSESLLQPPNGT